MALRLPAVSTVRVGRAESSLSGSGDAMVIARAVLQARERTGSRVVSLLCLSSRAILS